MRKRFRSLLTFFALLVVVAVVGALAVGLVANRAVRTAVESAGTKALSVPVHVKKADLSILGGSANLKDITVANPQGYERDNLLDLHRADIQVNTRSLLGDKVLIKEMKLDGMELFIEQKGTGNNLQDVIESLRRDRKPSGKALVIDYLEITNITAHAELLPVPGQDDTLILQLAPVKMTDLGRDEKMDTTILLSKIVLAIAAGLAEQGTDVLPKEMIGDLSSILDKAIDIGRIIFGNRRTGTDSKKGAGSIGEGISEGLKDLLKSNGKE